MSAAGPAMTAARLAGIIRRALHNSFARGVIADWACDHERNGFIFTAVPSGRRFRVTVEELPDEQS